jgi:DNA-binding winged helix-turn-helix (wHTH) protein
MSTRSLRAVRVIRFGEFELDLRAGELRRGEEKVRLQEQPYRILTMLLERPGEVVLREEICKRLWPNGTVVEVSHGINAAVLRLREALGDSAENSRFVETVARRGYRLCGPVEVEARRVVSERADLPAGAINTEELAPGQTITHFRLEERIGRGGMGVVYRAEDVNLHRPVALKFLAPEMASDPLAVGRFQREARTASALNHPHICTVYAVEECYGQPLIVMELLEGRSLESLLAEGPMPVGRALEFAIQMASALETAHGKGIVHRDLKPANVVVTRFGVKILDFGLAKQSVRGESCVTHSGSLLGTPNYMAPELFQGRTADVRSDLYSFGLILSEMLAGAAALEPLVQRALEANPENRWQTAGDLKTALEVAAVSRVPAPAVDRPVRIASSKRAAMVAGTLAAAVLAYGVFAVRPQPQAQPASRLAKTGMALQPKRPAVSGRMNISPDGRLLAYASGGEIYVRDVDGRESRLAASEGGNAGTPFWSPDSQSLAFTSGGQLFTVPTKGGSAKRVGDMKTALAGAWSADGTILIGELRDGLMAIPASGGIMRRITTPDETHGEARHLAPQFLPGGRNFIYTAGGSKPGSGMLYAGALNSTARTPILPIDSNATFVPVAGSKGFLIFERSGYLMAQAFDAAALQTKGEAMRVGGPVNAVPAAAATAISIAEFSAAGSTLVYRPLVAKSPLISMVSMPGSSPPASNSDGVVVMKDWLAGLPH